MSNFAGEWQYARQSAKANPVLEDMTIITVADDDVTEQPRTVTVKLCDPNSPPLELAVDTDKTDSSISFKMGTTHRGRLVILSAAEPAILVGSISKGTYPPSPGPVQDQDIDVFIAVKIC